MKKVLLIAYHFPPIGISSGVQRTLALTRYLKKYGWLPSVLTIDSRAYEKVNEDQLRDVPDYVEVKRARGLDTARHFSIRGQYFRFLALPDRWISWFFGGVLSGLSMIRKSKPDLIFSTYPIATAHLIGLALHRLTGVPWVADCRDSMVDESYPTNSSQRKTHLWIERQVVKHAAKVIMTTRGTREMYIERYPQIDSGKFAVISNGYDEEIFQQVEKKLARSIGKNEPLTLLHSGLMYPSERDPEAFFDALAELKEEGKVSSADVKIILRATGHDSVFQPMLNDRSIDDLVTLAPGVAYKEALQEMLSVDGLLLFQASNCNHQIPAKLYEYFRAMKPVLAFTDKSGDTAKEMQKADMEIIVDLADKKLIKEQLLLFIGKTKSGTGVVADKQMILIFSREKLVREFVLIFDDTC